MYLVRTIDEILDAAINSAKLRLKEKNKGKERYKKRMRNRKKIENKR